MDQIANHVTGTNAPAFIWAAVELTVGIICTCIPTFAHAVNIVFRRHKDSAHYNSKDGKHRNNEESGVRTGPYDWKDKFRGAPLGAQKLESPTGSMKRLNQAADLDLSDLKSLGRTALLEPSGQGRVEKTQAAPAIPGDADVQRGPFDSIMMQRDVWVAKDTVK